MELFSVSLKVLATHEERANRGNHYGRHSACELHAAGSARRSDWPSALRNIVPLRDRLPPADASPSHSRRQALAVVLRGDVRDTYQESSRALKLHLLHPAEQIGLAPHVFLVGYQEDSLAS